jgi:hypothetical protein
MIDRMRPLNSIVFATGGITAILLCTGCMQNAVVTEETHYDPVSVPLDSVKHAIVHLKMNAGEMELRGGAERLLEGTLTYNVAAWKPIVDTSVSGNDAQITIQEPERHRFSGDHTRYRWDLELNDQVPLTLHIACGAGRARLRLGNLDLEHVEVNMGAGQVDMDLRGKPVQSYSVHIAGGVGQATVWLPRDVGVRADAHGGLGSIDVVGLEKTDDHYENSLYHHANINIDVTVEGGIGQIRLVS